MRFQSGVPEPARKEPKAAAFLREALMLVSWLVWMPRDQKKEVCVINSLYNEQALPGLEIVNEFCASQPCAIRTQANPIVHSSGTTAVQAV